MVDQTKHEEILKPAPSKPETKDAPKVESKPAWEPGYYVGDYPPVHK